jgi:hypothetical protein
MRALVPKGDQERDKDKWYAKKEKKEEVEPVDELSNKKLADAQNKAGDMALAGSKKAEEQKAKFKRAQQQDRTADGVRKPSVGDKLKKAATKGAEKLGLKKRPERATGNPYGPEKMSRPGDHRYGKAPGGSLSGGYADHFDPEQSFDPGEESSNAPIPEGSFVAQVADYLAGNRK